MADYYPLIAKAVSGLDKSTGDTRRALYERARTALVAQLRDGEPLLSESDMTRERLALEEAIRKVEGEVARRSLSERGREPGQHWFVLLDGKRHGPFTFADITKAARSGTITAETNIWCTGWQKWHPARQVKELLNEVPLARDTEGTEEQREAEARQREEEERLRREAEARQREEEERLRREAEARQREEEERLRREAEARQREEEKEREREPDKKIGRAQGPVGSVPEALDSVLPVISFERSPGKNIRIKPGTEFRLQLPLPSSKRDHADRLTACRSLAENLKEELSQRQFEALSDFRDCIVRYLAAFPNDADPEHNFLPADNEARILRRMLALQAGTLGTSTFARFCTFLESHQGIRVFYPSLKRFYEDVRNGRIEEPLSLDAMMRFVAGIDGYTPGVFDPSVSSVFKGGSAPLPNIAPLQSDSLRGKDHLAQREPPPDPLGEIDLQKSHDFTFASMANSLWRVLLLGKKVGDTVEGWEKAFNTLKEPFGVIVDWLLRFHGAGPPMPPT